MLEVDVLLRWSDDDDDNDDDEEEWSVEMMLYLIEKHSVASSRLYLLSCEINSKFSIKIPVLFVQRFTTRHTLSHTTIL